MTTCKQCHTAIDELAVFPGGICVECYSQTDEAKRPLTAREIRQMFGQKG